ncbi:PAS domain-containing sensor histidine kinase [Pontibacter mangrovi]|uniref:histidine kinase n=1 Tax=Pontibacter mangrovi TaxID=2589816 RepID=A0A501W5Y2_9BACT|nr:PAS domain-containing sensor histidine kinase [Pontibacter mangrovi]TPE45303.1 PAS domain S-box protein [Pontibacter mangrovi]
MGSKINDTMLEKMAAFSPDLMCAIDAAGRFVHASNGSVSTLGYTSEELTDRHYSEFTYPDDLEATALHMAQLTGGGEAVAFESRMVHKAGHLVTLRWSAVWSEGDELAFCTLRDISAHKLDEHRLEVSEQKYKSLFNNNPDVIFLEDADGQVLEGNLSFYRAFGLAPEAILHRQLQPYLPPEMGKVCAAALHQALQGISSSFELVLYTSSQTERRVYDAVKQPVMIGGKVAFVQTIAKDITPMVRSYETIQLQANKLNTIFESITDAFFTLDRDWRFTYINHEAERLLHLDRKVQLGQNIWHVFPVEIFGEFQRQYQYAADTGKAVHFEAYNPHLHKWVEVKAFPSEEGISVYFTDITEKVEARKELEKLSLVASKTTNGVLILNKDFKIEWVNEGFVSLTGYSLQEAAGQTPFSLLHNPTADQSSLQAVMHKMQQGEPVSFEILRSKKSGEDLWLLVQVNPILDESGQVDRYVFIQSDITERVKSQEEISMLSLVASRTTNSVIIMNEKGQMEWVNEAFSHLTGYTLDEALGNKPFRLLQGPHTDQATLNRIVEKLASQQPIKEEILVYRKSGEERWFSIDVSPVLDTDGTATRYVGIQTDITDLKRSEQELSKLARDLYRQNSDLQQFSYIVSHNLRSPVANILGFTNILASIGKDSPVFDASIDKLKESARKLDEVLRDMNTILSIRDSKGNLELSPISLREVIDQAQASLHELLLQSAAEVTCDFGEDVVVEANRAYLYSIFHNLLSNAIKYRSALRPLQVTISCIYHNAQGTLISFSDNGSGFDMDQAREHVFKLYKRFHRNKEGSGIGLYLVKCHLEAMDGHIEVSSEVEKGTTFLIYLPGPRQ